MVWTELVDAREKRGWTQEELSRRVGVDVATIRRWEHRESMLQGHNKWRLMEALGLSSEDELGLDRLRQEVKRAQDNQIVLTSFSKQGNGLLARITRNDVTMRLFALASVYQDHREAQSHFMQIIKEYDKTMTNKPMTRRQILRRLLALPLITLSLLDSDTAGAIDHALSQYAVSIAAAWFLSKSQYAEDLADAFDAVTAYAHVLKSMVKYATRSAQRQAAASLAAQCDLLRAVLGWHLEGLKEATVYAREALFYSKGAEDIPLQIVVHRRLAWIYYYSKHYQQSLDEANQAVVLLKTSNGLPHLLHSNIYGTRAIRQALYQKDTDAIESLRLMHQHFEASSDDERQYSYLVDYDLSNLILAEGMTYAQLGKHDEALNSFAQIVDPEDLSTKVPIAERVRIEILNNQTMSLLKSTQSDMEQAIMLWKANIQGARDLRSKQRFSEAVTTYEAMQMFWPKEKRISDLREYVVHW
jgi:transcriptional regulator with XRE-family HTH domain